MGQTRWIGPRVKVVEIGNAEFTAKCTTMRWTDLTKINAQFPVALVLLCRDEALTVVRNSFEGQGKDAWSRLCE